MQKIRKMLTKDFRLRMMKSNVNGNEILFLVEEDDKVENIYQYEYIFQQENIYQYDQCREIHKECWWAGRRSNIFNLFNGSGPVRGTRANPRDLPIFNAVNFTI